MGFSLNQLPPDDGHSYVIVDGEWVREDEIKTEKDKWYRISQASQKCGKSTTTISNAIHFGFLKASKITDSSPSGFHYSINEKDLMDWIENPKIIKDANARKSFQERYFPNRVSKDSKKVVVKNEEKNPVEKKPETVSKATEQLIKEMIDEKFEKTIKAQLSDAYLRGYYDGMNAMKEMLRVLINESPNPCDIPENKKNERR